MAEKRGKVTPTASDQQPPAPVPDPRETRIRIRQRWELASVLNFLHVFKPLIGNELKISAEEIETALITPNDDLARIHIALLKGIPPVNRNLTVVDAWVTAVCKKLSTWWPWVAEGENPLKSDHGKEIERYKSLDPIIRVVILKALCEVRAEQDDVLRYIGDELKKGTEIATFRKERIVGDGNGVSYWYDGDPVIGYRLYKEVVQVDSKKKQKGKGRAAQPTIDYQWETLATELVEFQKISVNLSSSKINAEATLGGIVKTEILPVLEELQKKKERALKRQQRQALELNGFLNYSQVGVTRSCRERRPVHYTFDEYDRTIDEAIQISKKFKTTGSKDKVKQGEQVSHERDGHVKFDEGDSDTDGNNESPAEVEDNEYQCDIDEDDDEKNEDTQYQSDNDEDDDYDEKDENHEETNIEEQDDDFTSSDTEKSDSPRQTRNQEDSRTKFSLGLRRSRRFVKPTNGIAETKKTIRLTQNGAQIISDSEDSSSGNGKQIGTVSDSEIDG